MSTVSLPDGSSIDFPDNMSQDDINTAVQQHLDLQAQQQQTPFQRAGNFVGTSVINAASGIAGLPHLAATLGDKALDLFAGMNRPVSPDVDMGGSRTPSAAAPAASTTAPPPPMVPPGPGWLTRNTPSAQDIENWGFNQVSNLNQATGGKPIRPYIPETPAGQYGMDITSNLVPAILGQPEGLLSRLGASTVGTTASDLTREALPDHPWAAYLAGLAGGVAGGGLPAAGASLWNKLRTAWSPAYAQAQAGPQVAKALTEASGQTPASLISTIDTNAPLWTSGTRPDLGNVTESPGIRGMVYRDQTAAQRASDPIYQTNAAVTNAAQRQAVAGATPSDAATKLSQLEADRDTAVNAIPAGVDAQEAGNLLRTNLQAVKDQRVATRAAGGDAFSALETSPAQISMQPIMDYATEQAAKNAGVVGDAYKAALGQFKSGTGITLDTAPFANSVLKGLGDLAGSYPAGSSAARAVMDIKSRLQDQIGQEVPEVAAARATWEQNSRPLDVFDQAPFGRVLSTDRFGRAYDMPADAVAATFLRGNGASDSLDKLTGIFGDTESATQGLQTYIAGQVRQNALNPDGSVDLTRLQATLKPYQAALLRFPGLQKQFSTAEGAQAALNQQLSYQNLYDTASNGLGTRQLDAQGNSFYSPAQYDKFMTANKDLIDQAYTPEQAATVRRVQDELNNIAQTAYSKVPGTSGTAQSTVAGAEHGGGFRGVVGTVLGTWLASHLGVSPEGGGIIGSMIGNTTKGASSASQQAFDAVQRQALTDPAFARSLLAKYDASGLNNPASVRAMQYVAKRVPWGTLAASAGNSPGPMSYSAPASFSPGPQQNH